MAGGMVMRAWSGHTSLCGPCCLLCGPGQPASLPEHDASLAGMVEGFMS